MKYYFRSTVKYPSRAIQNKKEGNVYVMFTVNKEGIVVDPKIIRSADIDLSYEVVRVLLNSPRCEPGMQRGEAVDVCCVIKYSI
jgi:protein TonB